MVLPNAGVTYAQERLGIAAVQVYAARHKQIWRETNTGDVGIDGQLEFVNNQGFATGRILAVQVKAGSSYFSHPSPAGWKFYLDAKHRRYWESFPLPVLIVLHNTESGQSYWSDARQVLRAADGEPKFIEIPAANVLEDTDAVNLFENAGVQGQPFIDDITGVLGALIATTSNEGSFPLSYFDLFVHGLTNICRSIYYGSDVLMNAVEFNMAMIDPQGTIKLGEREHNFVFYFVKFLLSQDIAQIDYSDCLIDWVDRQMQPKFVAPLTSRGRALVDLISSEEERLVAAGKLPGGGGCRVAQEGILQMAMESYFKRFPRSYAFQKAFAAETEA